MKHFNASNKIEVMKHSTHKCIALRLHRVTSSHCFIVSIHRIASSHRFIASRLLLASSVHYPFFIVAIPLQLLDTAILIVTYFVLVTTKVTSYVVGPNRY
jgi:hypothetical protein